MDELDSVCKPYQIEDIQLATEGSDRSGDLDTEILVDVELAAFAVDVAQHGGGDGDGKDVVT